MSDSIPERELKLAELLEQFRVEYRSNGQIDLSRCRARHPEFAEELPALWEMARSLDTAADDWKLLDTFGESTGKTASSTAAFPELIGRYRVIEQLGSGGMATVYKARDPQLDRTVAVKVPHFNLPPTKLQSAVQRFLREARAAAQIRHPNICPIYDVGEQDGKPFAVMACIEGRTLADLNKQGKLEARHAAELVRKVALGLGTVHNTGLIHRDLKPSNVLLDSTGEPLLTDFGLVRLTEDVEHLTQSGTMVGTPAYMSPEQAAGENERIGPTTDIYSLGVVLYQLLTGRLPFEGPPLTVLYKIVNESPPKPSSIQPGLDPKLEAICLKAMAKRPEHRYQSAREFASALEQSAQPQTVRAPWRFRARLTSIAAAVLLVVCGTVVVQQVVVKVRDKAGQVKKEFPLEPGDTIEIAESGDSKPKPGTRESHAQTIINPEPLSISPGSPLSPLAWVRRPAAIPGVQSWTIETARPRGSITTMAFSPNNSVLATSGVDAVVRLIDSQSGRLIRALVGHGWEVSDVEWSPDGRYLAEWNDDGTVRIWDADNGQPLRVLRIPGAALVGISWSPNGSLIATGTNDWDVWIWNVDSAKTISTLKGHENGISSVTWSPLGQTLASRSIDGTIRLWNTDSGRTLWTSNEPRNDANTEAWSPDGRVLAGASVDGKLWLRDGATGKVLHSINVSEKGEQSYQIFSVTWSRDGETVATLRDDNLVQFWDEQSGQSRGLLSFHWHKDVASAMSWSSDGKTLAAASRDGTVSLYDLDAGHAYRTLSPAPVDFVNAVAGSPDGKQVAINVGKETWIVHIESPDEPHRISLPADGNTPLVWSADGKLLAAPWGEGSTFKIVDVETGELRQQLDKGPVQPGQMPQLAWSPDGLMMAFSGSGLLPVRIRNAATGENERDFEDKVDRGAISNVSWSPDGTIVATTSDVAGGPRLWRANSGEVIRDLEPTCAGYASIAWHPTSRRLAAKGSDEAAYLWDVPSGQLLQTLHTAQGSNTNLAWLPDGRTLASSGTDTRGYPDHRLSLWDSQNGELVQTFPGVLPGKFAGDGSLLLSPHQNAVHLTDVRTGRSRGTILHLAGQCAILSPDGHLQAGPEFDTQIVYVIQTEEGQQTLTANDFTKKYMWKNDPQKARMVMQSPTSDDEVPDRQAAQRVLSLGGSITVRVGGDDQEVRVANELPAGDWRLTAIDLSNNQQVDDAALMQLRSLTSLSHIDLRRTRVTDVGLAYLKDVNSLMSLHLGGTQVGDDGVAHLRGLSNLKRLWLYHTKVSDIGLESIKQLKQLTLLELGGTQISGDGLRNLNGFTELTYLSLPGLSTDDVALMHLKGLTKLTDLFMVNANIGDRGLEQIKHLTTLRNLDLTGTRVSDGGLGHLKNLDKLVTLNVINTRVSVTGVASLQEALPNCEIRFKP